MQAFRKPSPLATQPQSARPAFDSSALESPEQSAAATSGTFFKAVRPTDSEAAALARGEPVVDCAKIEGLRFELDMGIWRADAERIAHSVIADAGDLGEDE